MHSEPSSRNPQVGDVLAVGCAYSRYSHSLAAAMAFRCHG